MLVSSSSGIYRHSSIVHINDNSCVGLITEKTIIHRHTNW